MRAENNIFAHNIIPCINILNYISYIYSTYIAIIIKFLKIYIYIYMLNQRKFFILFYLSQLYFFFGNKDKSVSVFSAQINQLQNKQGGFSQPAYIYLKVF